MARIREINIFVKGDYVATTHQSSLKAAKARFLANPRVMGVTGIRPVPGPTEANVKCEFADTKH